MNEPKLMTIKEAARYAHASRNVIDVAIWEGELRFVLMGKATRRIRLEDLEKWIASKTVKEIKR